MHLMQDRDSISHPGSFEGWHIARRQLVVAKVLERAVDEHHRLLRRHVAHHHALDQQLREKVFEEALDFVGCERL